MLSKEHDDLVKQQKLQEDKVDFDKENEEDGEGEAE